ncbi:MAG: hypothetical protein EOO96_01885 [Pedobacter sp.]|nr:MAG: hypothetical protein EOO96_01885 [Pedobacter sp.]
MNKIILLFLLPVSLLLNVEWERVAIDKKVSVLLPKPIEKLNVDGKDAWYGEIDSAGKCMVMITDMGKMGMDSKTLAEELKRKEFYGKLKNGLALGSNGKPRNGQITTFKGYHAYKIDITMEEEEGTFDTKLLNFFIGAKMYTFSVISQKGTTHSSAEAKLISSIIIK